MDISPPRWLAAWTEEHHIGEILAVGLRRDRVDLHSRNDLKPSRTKSQRETAAAGKEIEGRRTIAVWPARPA